MGGFLFCFRLMRDSDANVGPGAVSIRLGLHAVSLFVCVSLDGFSSLIPTGICAQKGPIDPQKGSFRGGFIVPRLLIVFHERSLPLQGGFRAQQGHVSVSSVLIPEGIPRSHQATQKGGGMYMTSPTGLSI